MDTDDLTPQLSKLEKDYQLLTELHRDGTSRTYLARHLRLNRDVTITVMQTGAGDDGNALTHFAADARLLTAMRHPNVIPVIDGTWLDDRTFAVVRARVRGSTLDQLINANGALPIGRVSTTIQQVHAAIAWARGTGVVHRRITPASLMFQQGNGRVFLNLELSPIAPEAMPDECDDARTIGRLAWDMLLGRIADRDEAPSAVVVPPNIIPSVTRAIEAVRRCHHGNSPQVVSALLSALQTAAIAAPTESEPLSTQPIVSEPMASDPIATGAATEQTPDVERVVVFPPGFSANRAPSWRQPPAEVGAAPAEDAAPAADAASAPLHHYSDDAVVRVKSPFGFNARLGTAVAVAAIIGIMALLLLRDRAGTPKLDAAAILRDSLQDTLTQAAGDVSLGAGRSDSATKSSSPPPPIKSQTRRGTPVRPENPESASAAARRRLTPPETRRHEPPRTTPSSTFPATSTNADGGLGSAVCRSPSAADQHQCLMAAINRNDAELNTVYSRVIGALRRESSASARDPDPPSVQRLRASQRRWVDDRDVACRRVGSGPLYARERSSCFAQQTANRARELQRILDGVSRN